ncbi:MAG: flavin reductase [Chloroflexota bacterium]|nr:MAG: flavin reductase [Chloroflexota bacterium]
MVDIDGDRFRQLMGRFVTGVSVVTTISDGRPAGITVNALSPVSLEPPLVMVALDRRRFIHPMVRGLGRYAVNVLGEGQQALSDCFAHAAVKPGELGREEFCGAAWHAGPTGLPILDGAIAGLECTVVETYPAGDHDLFIGRVDALDDGGPGAEEIGPLLYFRRRYLRIEQAAHAEVEGKPEA